MPSENLTLDPSKPTIRPKPLKPGCRLAKLNQARNPKQTWLATKPREKRWLASRKPEKEMLVGKP